jgi:hypothetical protein
MSVGVILIAVMLVLVVWFFRREVFQPASEVVMQAGLVVVYEHACRDVHRVDET